MCSSLFCNAHSCVAVFFHDLQDVGLREYRSVYFYQHTPLRSLEEVTAEILALERETEGLLKKLVSFGEAG